MYLGSVKFFKHAIYMTLALAIWVLVFGLYSFGNLLLSTHLAPQGAIAEAQSGYGTDYGDENENIDLSSVESDILDINEETGEEPVDKSVEGSADLLETGVLQNHLLMPPVSQIGYQFKYPDLYSELPKEFISHKKVAYLTFDDGPSSRTLEILDILKEHDVKGTFFVITENADPAVLRRIVEEGHAIGVHTHSHKYKEIYRSVENFLDDFYIAYQKIYEATSVNPTAFRFPGGSINAYNIGIYQELISEMLRRGFLYYDWNISCMDANPNMSSEEIVETVKASINGHERLMILAHDSVSKKETVEALPEIIKYIKDAGYTFERCDSNVEPVVFVYPNL